jgi:hypothetical protein
MVILGLGSRAYCLDRVIMLRLDCFEPRLFMAADGWPDRGMYLLGILGNVSSESWLLSERWTAIRASL